MDFFNELDRYLKNNDLNGSKNFIEDSLEKAIKDGNTALIIQILNEAIGFYRDISEFDISVKYAASLQKLIKKISLNYKDEVTTLINIANAYRAGLLLQEAKSVFEEALFKYNEYKLSDNNLIASLYNNEALLYEEMNKFDMAIKDLNNALEYVTDDIKIASTHVNLGMCYLRINDLENTLFHIKEAHKTFSKYPNDFHYSGYLALCAKYYNLTNNEEEAISYYEKALANLLKTVGQNSYYKELKEELFNLYDKKHIAHHIKGLDLSYQYYLSNKEKLFDLIPSSAKEYITIGLFGLGSECFGADDEISEDHDFDQGFVILVENSVSLEDFNIIKDAYDKLPKIYGRFYLLSQPKHGVHYISEYYKNYLGITTLDNIDEYSKALLCNGKIFHEGFMASFSRLRYEIRKKDNYEYLTNLALKALDINKYIPYNLNRAKSRNDIYTYKSLKNNLVNHLIEFYYIYHKEYLPHDKLRLTLMEDSSIIKKWIYYILDNEDITSLNEQISAKILQTLHRFNIISNVCSLYIDDYKNEIVKFVQTWPEKRSIVDEIVKIEYSMFKKLNNIGGEASCQKNYDYFKLMRESQYLTYNMELLKSYLHDLELAVDNNYNLLEIKYGFMEQTTDPANYEKIKDRLPKLSEFQTNVISSVCEIVLQMKEEYDKTPHAKMRDNSSIYDNYNNASYETYLKGELSSYSENTLYLYARMIANISNNKQNIVLMTTLYTYFLRCGESVD